MARREAREAYLWIGPWIVGFLVFVLGPMIASLVLSFTKYEGLSKPEFIGLENYTWAFTRDRLFYGSIRRTFYYSLVSVPLGLFSSFFLAMLLNQALRLKAFYRTLFYLPSLTPTVALTILWLWILQPQYGLVNHTLRQIGIDGPAWFGSMKWAIPSLIIMHLWNSVGGGRMIIFLAALQGVPQELYEAAEIDGAGGAQKFWHVTLPIITPAIFFNLVMGIIGAFSVFAVSYVATDGGPMYATWFYMLHLVRNALQYFHMGYASALAWILFIILLVFTFLQLRLSGRWVYYAGGG